MSLPPTATIHKAAELMCEQSVSSLMIIERDHLFGLVTDRDLRNRVLACGLAQVCHLPRQPLMKSMR